MIGSILPFVAGSAGGPFEGLTEIGLRFSRGKFHLGVGIGLVLIAVLTQTLRLTLYSRRILGVVAIVGGASSLYWSLKDISEIPKLPEVDVGTGLYVVLVGGIIGLVGGVLSVIARGRSALPGPEPGEPSMPALPPEKQPPEQAPS
ncbi:MAG TPA: hypothetical protein VE915_06160 [Actinomycetota bacterium]|nr:hypothetical protein [Actinomycetota bacterium]